MTPWTVASKTPLSMGFSRHEYRSGKKKKNTEVDSLSLLQGIFPTQGSNPGLLHCRQILYQLSYQGSPRILEWVAYTFSRGSSPPRNGTRVSCIAGKIFTSCATREAPIHCLFHSKAPPLCQTLCWVQRVQRHGMQVTFAAFLLIRWT